MSRASELERDILDLEEDKKRLKRDKRRLRADKKRLREQKHELRKEVDALVDDHEKLEIAVEHLDDPRLNVYVGRKRWEAKYKALKDALDELPVELPEHIEKI